MYIAACSHKIYSPTETDLAWAKTKWSNADMAQLMRGKTYYKANCGKCHGLKNPAKYTEEEWNRIMPKMKRKARIADSTSNIILTYVLTSAHGLKQENKRAVKN